MGERGGKAQLLEANNELTRELKKDTGKLPVGICAKKSADQKGIREKDGKWGKQ